jgi:hypothetical protein
MVREKFRKFCMFCHGFNGREILEPASRLACCLLGFADLHVLVDGQDGVTDGGICGRGSVVGGDGEVTKVSTADFVAVALAFGAREVHSAGRREFVEGDAVAIRSDIGALGLHNLRKVHSNAGEAYGLGGCGAGIGGGHFLDGIEIDATHDGCDDE